MTATTAPPPRRARRAPGPRPHWWVVVGAVVSVLVVSATVYVARGGDAEDVDEAEVVDTRPPVTTRTGVFRGTDVAGARAFETWLGRKVEYVVDFSSRATWLEISDPGYMIKAWQGSGYRPVYSVAMLPEDPADTMERGAGGEYNRYFTKLAQRLVQADQEDAIIRLGWEFNLAESRWATDDPDVFIAYYRHVVTAMRDVNGQKFEFDWNPNNGTSKFDAAKYYPGNDVVDYVGIDAYDTAWDPSTYPYPDPCDAACRTERQTNAWNRSIHGGPRGLKFWSGFARSKGKPMSLPEWGIWERSDGRAGGDNPVYLRRMHAFINDPKNRVAYQAYFEFDGHDGPHRLMTTYPESGKVFRTLFAGAGAN